MSIESNPSHDECPTGYARDTVNIPNVGSSLGIHFATREECADLCFQFSECVSFEHSHNEMRCNLNPMGQLQGSLNGYLFCYNIGNIELLQAIILKYHC